ncbi:MAG: fumarylacetoacetate hydrolase family protein, partial [Candidatus Dormibacteraceae bacterium]
MRLANLRAAAGTRLHVRTSAGYVDVARATGDPRLASLPGLLATGEPGLARVAELPPGDDGAGLELGPAVERPGKILCIGRNYTEHIDEVRARQIGWPEVFAKYASTVIGPFDEIVRPSVSEQVDYEGELGVVIGRAGRHVSAERAMELVFGFCAVNDVSIRDWQGRGTQWTPGKNFDRTFPIGPEVVTADEVDWRDLGIETRLNGDRVQASRTSLMLFDIPAQIEFITSWLTLEPGDVIATGTPGGAGKGRRPPLWMRAG